MTSSLVGSEMCIRDRPRRRAVATAAWCQQHGQQLLVGRRHSTSLEEEPVSYTHLTLPTICSV
eukprot:12787995-Prorocentrum_lima.AAC.1